MVLSAHRRGSRRLCRGGTLVVADLDLEVRWSGAAAAGRESLWRPESAVRLLLSPVWSWKVMSLRSWWLLGLDLGFRTRGSWLGASWWVLTCGSGCAGLLRASSCDEPWHDWLLGVASPALACGVYGSRWWCWIGACLPRPCRSGMVVYVLSAVRGVGVPRRVDHDGEVLRQRLCALHRLFGQIRW